MDGASGMTHTETLGERLCRFSEGDPCPCCGMLLEADAGGSGASRLTCPKCGCEIGGDEEPPKSWNRHLLSAA